MEHGSEKCHGREPLTYNIKKYPYRGENTGDGSNIVSISQHKVLRHGFQPLS